MSSIKLLFVSGQHVFISLCYFCCLFDLTKAEEARSEPCSRLDKFPTVTIVLAFQTSVQECGKIFQCHKLSWTRSKNTQTSTIPEKFVCRSRDMVFLCFSKVEKAAKVAHTTVIYQHMLATYAAHIAQSLS